MVTVILSHEVKNFSEWKKVFDADETNRQQVGVKTHGIYTAVDNPNLVSVINEIPSLEALNEMMSNPDMKAKMEAAGVIGMPEVKILKKM